MKMSDEIAKLERDGKVAVLVSHGYGAGWSTWNELGAQCVFDPEIAQAILDGNRALALEVAKRKYPDVYCGGIEDLSVEWVNKGDRFEIHEYDGSESLRVFGPDDGYVA
jgi:hypothetical protein